MQNNNGGYFPVLVSYVPFSLNFLPWNFIPPLSCSELVPMGAPVSASMNIAFKLSCWCFSGYCVQSSCWCFSQYFLSGLLQILCSDLLLVLLKFYMFSKMLLRIVLTSFIIWFLKKKFCLQTSFQCFSDNYEKPSEAPLKTVCKVPVDAFLIFCMHKLSIDTPMNVVC